MSEHFRVSGAASARRLHHEHPVPDPRTVGDLGKRAKVPKAERFHRPGQLEAAGGNGFEFEPNGFHIALTNLISQCHDFERALARAAGLGTDLPDGHGPVAAVVGKAFNHRLGDQGGMQYAVRTHAEHLVTLVSSLQETASNYQEADQEAGTSIGNVGPQGDPR